MIRELYKHFTILTLVSIDLIVNGGLNAKSMIKHFYDTDMHI